MTKVNKLIVTPLLLVLGSVEARGDICLPPLCIGPDFPLVPRIC